MLSKWQPPSAWKKISTIDAHTAGEPLRILAGGTPEIPGDTILEKRNYVKTHLDWIRTALMWEPRGHSDMYGCIVTKPVTPDGEFGVIFLHNEGYSTMCGHGIIAVTKVLLDTGFIKNRGNKQVINIDTPAGRITATAYKKNGVVKKVCFRNVPSFVVALDEEATIPGLGTIQYDIAYGGAFYVFCKANNFNLDLDKKDFSKLIDIGMCIKKAFLNSNTIKHPFEKDLSYLYGTILVGPPHNPSHHSRNVCIFAEGEVDRSPTGTGVSAKAAIHFAKGELKIGEQFTVESILGTCFNTKVIESVKYGPHNAVIPEVCGEAFITGKNEYYFDPEDPLKNGFILR